MSRIFLVNFNHLDIHWISTEDPNIKFHEIPLSGHRADTCIQMARQTDRHDKGNGFFLQLCSEPKTAFCSKHIYIFCTILTIKSS